MDIPEAVTAVAAMEVLYPRLHELAMLIEQFEGYDPGSRSYANNNPGNLRGSRFRNGTKAGYAEFESYFHGFFALLWDLWSKAQGRTSTTLGPDSTIRDLIEVYSPSGDANDPTAYMAFITQRSVAGIRPDKRLYWLLEK